jgi:riboflavin transporter FmnP
MDNAIGQVMAIFAGLLTVAIVALLVSKNATTAQDITAFTQGFAQDLNAAVSPVTGASGIGTGVNGMPNLGI